MIKRFMGKSFVHGWMGKTHALMSVMLLCLLMLVPINVFKETFGLLRNNILFFIVGIVVLIGGALLPDLDNGVSSAGSTLGFMGTVCTAFMQSTSSLMWTLLHGKRDKHPESPHRYFWHTLIVSVGLICLFLFGLPKGDITIINDIKEKSFLNFLQSNITVIFFILITFMAVLCGSNIVMHFFIKTFNLPKLLNYICPVAVIVYISTIDYNHIRILGLCIGLGYLFHCIEDIFADTGVPFLWPIPIHGQLWKRIAFIKTCQTGGLVNTILDIVILAIDILLIALILLKGTTL